MLLKHRDKVKLPFICFSLCSVAETKEVAEAGDAAVFLHALLLHLGLLFLICQGRLYLLTHGDGQFQLLALTVC